jgi:hypothetical protein
MKPYYAYLLRLWPGDDANEPVWRASLEDPHTRQMIQFARLADLYAHLTALTAQETLPKPIHPPVEETAS